MRSEISDAILLEERNIIDFPFEKKQKALFIYLSSILGKDKADVLYNEILAPNLKIGFNHRTNFEYHISIEEINNELRFDDTIEFNKNEYIIIHQDLQYRKNIPLSGRPSIKIAFAISSEALHDWFLDEDIFFREWIDLNLIEKNKINELNEEDIKKFITNILEVKLSFFKHDNKEINIEPNNLTVKRYNNSGFVMEYGLCEDDFCPTSYHARVSFKMPQRKSAKKFLASIPEVTYRPRITFRHTQNMEPIDAITFFPNNNQALVVTSRRLEKEVSCGSWVFPRSGVIFLWN